MRVLQLHLQEVELHRILYDSESSTRPWIPITSPWKVFSELILTFRTALSLSTTATEISFAIQHCTIVTFLSLNRSPAARILSEGWSQVSSLAVVVSESPELDLRLLPTRFSRVQNYNTARGRRKLCRVSSSHFAWSQDVQLILRKFLLKFEKANVLGPQTVLSSSERTFQKPILQVNSQVIGEVGDSVAINFRNLYYVLSIFILYLETPWKVLGQLRNYFFMEM